MTTPDDLYVGLPPLPPGWEARVEEKTAEALGLLLSARQQADAADRAMLERLLSHQAPRSPDVGDRLDNLRGAYLMAGDSLIEHAPPGDDRGHAIRLLHMALQYAVAAVVCNQDVIMEAMPPERRGAVE